MNFSDWAVIVVFGFLGYLIVGSTLNWLEEKKAGQRRQGQSGHADSQRTGSDSGQRTGDAFTGTAERVPAWYEVLEVSEFATVDQIRAAYKQKISQYHPDKVASMAAEIRDLAEVRSKEINAAYDEAMKTRSP